MGAKLGSEAIPLKWREPLQDSFSTYVKGYEKWKISELAQKIVKIGKDVIVEKAKAQVRVLKSVCFVFFTKICRLVIKATAQRRVFKYVYSWHRQK